MGGHHPEGRADRLLAGREDPGVCSGCAACRFKKFEALLTWGSQLVSWNHARRQFRSPPRAHRVLHP